MASAATQRMAQQALLAEAVVVALETQLVVQAQAALVAHQLFGPLLTRGMEPHIQIRLRLAGRAEAVAVEETTQELPAQVELMVVEQVEQILLAKAPVGKDS